VNLFGVCGQPIGIVPISNEVPKSFGLLQNYPNPFNPATKIRFNIPPAEQGSSLFTKLTVYDILGKEVSLLVNEHLQPGKYEVTFNTKNLPSGIYFYRLTSGEFNETKKMLLVK
jgi:hypothetical protein